MTEVESEREIIKESLGLSDEQVDLFFEACETNKRRYPRDPE